MKSKLFFFLTEFYFENICTERVRHISIVKYFEQIKDSNKILKSLNHIFYHSYFFLNIEIKYLIYFFIKFLIFEILFEQNKKKVRTKDKKPDKLIKYQSKYTILYFNLKFQFFEIFEINLKFCSNKNFKKFLLLRIFFINH